MPEGQKHLLIVDDEHALREAIAERLADHGFIVEQAASGKRRCSGSPTSRSTS
jgi:DNA-binding response OmpR family regulator